MVRVGFSTPSYPNPVSALVRWVTKSRASHAFFLYWDQDFELDMVIEAHELGFRLVPFKHFERYNKIIAVYNPKRPIDVGVRRVAQNYLSSHYDFTGLLGMAVVKLGRWLKRKWKNPFRDAKHVFCSESVALAMQWSAGYTDFTEDAETIDPEGLMSYFGGDGSELLT